LFEGAIGEGDYLLSIAWLGGEQLTEDPYSFGPLLGDLDLHLILLFFEKAVREIGQLFLFVMSRLS
jgi:hypothetical protein